MESPKKMSLTQLTVLVAVNMMGSGVIILPTNMAQVGAISLLSWPSQRRAQWPSRTLSRSAVSGWRRSHFTRHVACCTVLRKCPRSIRDALFAAGASAPLRCATVAAGSRHP